MRTPRARKPHKTSIKNHSIEDFTEEETEEEDEEEGLPEWAQVPRYCAPQVQSICTLLSEEAKQGSSNIHSILRRLRFNLTPEIVLGVLKNYRRIGRDRTLQFFSWAGSRNGYRHDNTVVDYMADFLGRRKLFDDLRYLLKTMSAERIDLVTPWTVSIAVRYLGRAGRVDEAMLIFEQMENEYNFKPDNLVFNNVLYVLCKSSAVNREQMVTCVEKGLSIFEKMGCPDTYSYSNVIIGLCKIGRVEEAMRIFDEMQGGRVRVSPTRTAINHLIGELCEANMKQGSVSISNVKVRGSSSTHPIDILVPNLKNKNYLDMAKGVFWKISDLGVFPSVFVLNMLLEELSRSGKVEFALKIFNLIADRGLRRDGKTYNIIIQALFKMGRSREASGIFSQMISEGSKPDILMYNSVISSLCTAGNLKDADNYFDMMKKKRGLPNNVTYTALIHGHCKADNWQEASTLLNELLGLGWSPHSHTFNLVDGLLRKAGKYDIAEKLLLKMESLHIHNDCKAGDWEAAYRTVNKMLERGSSPHVYTLDLVEQALRKAGKWGIVQEFRCKFERVSTVSSTTDSNSASPV
jgi:pentatricopeptide repeat protein